ncbi:MAG: hypothetical protein KBT11_07275 [Treponema sp.]|nr:hypothetical protein [Candidatus Treponema equifaecale]
MSSSPEVKKKNELKKIEAELKNLPSQIYKNGMLQPNFAELFRILYENTKPIDDILSSTINSENSARNKMFENQLVVTGFMSETQDKIESLEFDNRKKAVIDSDLPLNKVLESQKHTLETILKQINAPEFAKIDSTISKLHQLVDICRYNYINVLKVFDPDFDGIASSSFGIVSAAAAELVESQMRDLYYILGNFSIDSAEVRAIVALKQLSTGNALSEKEQSDIVAHLKKINSVFGKYLTPDVIKKVICLGKKDPAATLETMTYRSNSLKNFTEYFQNKFNGDSERIKGEIKDYNVSFEIKKLFEGKELFELKGYNSETNDILRKSTPYSFTWITPVQLIKTFMSVYLNESVMGVMNNIVIEGFFNNPSYKSEFSAMVYYCDEINENIKKFEDSFDRGKQNDQAEIVGLIRDSRKDTDFLKKVGAMVDNINAQAQKLVQESAKGVYDIYVNMGEMILDAKKSKSDVVSNIKVLLTSSRNRDGSGMIEQQYENWKLFLKVMKNYAIIGEIEKNND